MPDPQQRHYRFGPFRLDVQTRELRNGEAPVVLTAKAFDVLRMLVEHRERVVGRDELLSTVWAGRVVEENNLTQAIAALRRAFGTDAQDHRYIVTVPGRGYRFIADIDDDPPPAAAPSATTAATTPPRLRRMLWAGMALLVAAALGATWWTRREAAIAPSPVADDGRAPLTLAVLPFRTLAPGPEDELLGLGLADTLITRISGSTSLRVRTLPSHPRFANAARDPVEAARELGTAYLVDGSTQRSGDMVKVNARLLAADGSTLWTGTFDAPLERIFTLQDEIADALAGALAVKVSVAVRRSPCDGDDPAAYRAYLSGQYRMARPSAASVRRALADFRRALDLDPTCARAHAALANAWRTLVPTADADPRDAFARAQASVDRALALEPRLPEAHLVQGWIHFWYHWDWAASEASFRRAIELNPSLADAHFGYAHLLANLGRDAEAAAHAREAMALDPLSPVINAVGGWFVAKPPEAARYMERALELDPDYWLALLLRGSTRIRDGETAAGLRDLDRARTLCGDCSHALAVRASIAARGGQHEVARSLLRELEAHAATGYRPASALAAVHAALGDNAAALDQLERAWRARDMRMAFLRADEPFRWQGLRADPRYQALMRAMNFDGERATGLRTGTPASPTPSAADRSSR